VSKQNSRPVYDDPCAAYSIANFRNIWYIKYAYFSQ